MTLKENSKKEKQTIPGNRAHSPKRAYSALTLDVDYYQSFLDDTNISEDKKRELIQTLWDIMSAFVDLGFGIHPVQQAMGNDAPDVTKFMTATTEFKEHPTQDNPTKRKGK